MQLCARDLFRSLYWLVCYRPLAGLRDFLLEAKRAVFRRRDHVFQLPAALCQYLHMYAVVSGTHENARGREKTLREA